MPIPNQAAYDGLGTLMRVMPSGGYPGFPSSLVQGGVTPLQVPTYQIDPGGKSVRGGMTRDYQHFTGPGWFGPDHDTQATGLDSLNRSQVRAGDEQFVFNLPVVFRFPPNIGKVATATANWADAAVPTVAATDNATGAVVSIRLPRTRSGDPNVRTGATIPYITDNDGLHWAVSDYMDDKVGMVKLWSLAVGAIPAGWEVLSLVTNGQYLRLHKTTAGTTGGSATHTHAVSGNTANESAHTHGATGLTATDSGHGHGNTFSVAANTISLAANSTDAATVTISGVNTDTKSGLTTTSSGATTTGGGTNHDHVITRTNGLDFTYGGGQPGVISVTTPTATESAHTHSVPNHTHDVTDHNHSLTLNSVGSHSHAMTGLTAVGSHGHSLTGGVSSGTASITMGGNTAAGSAHLHTVSITSGNNSADPLFYDLIPIIRVA